MTKEELYKKRDAVMERFDFEKVLAHMDQVDWKWQSSSEYRRPTIFELRGTARFVLGTVIDSDEPSSNASSGGFSAYKFPWGIELVFSVEHRSSF